MGRQIQLEIKFVTAHGRYKLRRIIDTVVLYLFIYLFFKCNSNQPNLYELNVRNITDHRISDNETI